MTKLFRSIPLQLVHAYEKLHPFYLPIVKLDSPDDELHQLSCTSV
jgi:hypothetical protein